MIKRIVNIGKEVVSNSPNLQRGVNFLRKTGHDFFEKQEEAWSKKFLARANSTKESKLQLFLSDVSGDVSWRMLERFGRSTSEEAQKIEKELATKGVTARFSDNVGMAKKTKEALNSVENAGYSLSARMVLIDDEDLPKAVQGLTLKFSKKNAHKAPIFLPKKILKRTPEIAKKLYEMGESSTPNPAHTIFHEIGHWFHFQNCPSTDESIKIWKTADKELIGSEVSKNALRRADGAEFVAEVFAGIVDGKTYDTHIMDIYKKLKGPMPNNL